AGAVDYLPKNFEDISRNVEKVKTLLCEKVLTVANGGRHMRRSAAAHVRAERPPLRSEAPTRTVETSAVERLPAKRKAYKLVAIGTSTGGPVALQRVLTQLPANFPTPIVLIQHMPAAFTGAFAERLDKLCKIRVKEAEDGDILRPGLALLAPGGKTMMLDARGAVKSLPGAARLN